MLARQISNSPEQMVNVFRDICSISVDDGATFDLNAISAEPITEDADYSGIRMKIPCSLDRSRNNVQFDIGFGDLVIPTPERMRYPSLLDMDEADLWVYSKESIIAEKFQAMVYLAQANSRMKDFYDIREVPCAYCGVSFFVVGERMRRYCSRICSAKARAKLARGEGTDG